MAPTLKKVAIIGASGNIGKIILKGLVASSKFDITVITRKESKAVFPSGVTIAKSEYSEDNLEAAFRGQDAVISAVGAQGFGEQRKFVDAAVRAKVKLFIPSEFSASSQNEAVLQLLPLFAAKNDLINYLKSKESEGLTWTGIATSGLLDWSLENGFLEFDIPTRTATIWDGGNKDFTLINEEQLGQSVVSILENPREVRNRYIYVASVETTQQGILAALEKATGTKWSVNETTTEHQVNEGVKKLQAGDFSGAFMLVRATVFGNTPDLRANYVKNNKVANAALGLEMESVEETVQRVVGNQFKTSMAK